MSLSSTKITHIPGGAYLQIGEDANGLPAILTTGPGTDDATIVSDIGPDTLWADGSIYVSVVDGAGKLFLKVADNWTDQK